MSVILEARGLIKNFGAVTAAADINVSIESDSVVGLIGIAFGNSHDSTIEVCAI